MNEAAAYETAVQHLAELTVGSVMRGAGGRRIDSATIQDLRVRVKRYPIFVAIVRLTRDGTESHSVWELSVHSDGADYAQLLKDAAYREAMAYVVEANIAEWLSLRGTSVAPDNVEARQLDHEV